MKRTPVLILLAVVALTALAALPACGSSPETTTTPPAATTPPPAATTPPPAATTPPPAATTPPPAATTPPPAATTPPPTSGIAITWQQRNDYMGKDVVVSVTGPIMGTMDVFPPALTVFMGGVQGAGLDLLFMTASMFDKSWDGKTLTATGKIVANDYGTAQMAITSVSQISNVK